MGSVFGRILPKLEKEKNFDQHKFIVLSHELSPWKDEHFFSVHEDVEGEEMTTLSGDYFTKVFEGPYKEAKYWDKELQEFARSKGKEPEDRYF